jgi:hypothetical protein
VYEPEPPVDAVTVNVTPVLWLTSNVDWEGTGVFTTSAASTVNVNDSVTVPPFESVTMTWTVYGDERSSPDAGVQLNDAVVGVPQPEGSPDHA